MLFMVLSYYIFPDTITKLNVPGEPELPVLRFFIEDTTGIKIDIVYRDSLLKDKIFPKQFPVRKDGKSMNFIISETYKKDIFFPEKIYDIKKIGRRNKKDIYLLEIYTHRYNPYKNILLYPEVINISPLKRFTFKKQDNKVLYILNEPFLNKLKKHMIFRKLQGYQIDTVIVQPSTDTITIRDLIILKDPDYVLIIGDTSNVKTYITMGDYDNTIIYTDLFYGVSDTGFIPDRIVGRISVNDTVELENFIDKIIEFETSQDSYLNKGYFVSTTDLWYHQLVEQTHKYSMDTLRNRGYVCDSLWGYYKTGTPIDSAFTYGRNIIVYSGHGSEIGWLGPNFSITDFNKIEKNFKYPIILNFACKTGNFSYPECFTEALLRRKSKGSAFTFGASTYSYWDEDDILQKRIIDLYKRQEIIGNVVDSARILFLQYFGMVSMTKQYFKEYNLFGDPLIRIRDGTEIPIYSNIPKFFPKTCTLNLVVEDKTGSIPFKIGFEQNYLFQFDSGTGKIDISFDNFDTGYVNYFISSTLNHIPIFSGLKLIPDGVFIKTQSFNVSYDTLIINIKNYGNQTFLNGYLLLNPFTQNINFEIDSFFFDSIRPFNDTTIKTIFYSTEDSVFIELSFISDSFSTYDTILLKLNIPEFKVESDTFYLYKNNINRLSFNIKNTSKFNVKNISIKLNVNDSGEFDSSEFFIDELGTSSLYSIKTNLFVKETDYDSILIVLNLKCWNYNKDFEFYFNLKDSNLLPPHYLYSNVSKGDVIFLTEASNVLYDINLKYFDISGRKVRDINIRETGNIIDKTNLNTGIYFVHYTSSQNKWIKKILILK